MGRFVIFNADDCNFCPGVTRGIIDAVDGGVVSAVSVMANLPGASETIGLLNRRSVDAGLHVNLTFGSPVSCPLEIPSLLDGEDRFIREPGRIPCEVSREELEREISAQVEASLRMGLVPTHIDTHHHLHAVDERVLIIVAELALRMGIVLRSTDEFMRTRLRKWGVRTPDHFIGDFFGDAMITPEKLRGLLESSPEGVTEVMCHPGYPDEFLRENSSYVESRERELALLTRQETRDMLQSLRIKAISYRDMGQESLVL